MTDLADMRRSYEPKIPELFRHFSHLQAVHSPIEAPSTEVQHVFPKSVDLTKVHFQVGGHTTAAPLKVGVLFSGGQASGGHNVVAGLFDALVSLHPESSLLGFQNGPIGLINGDFVPLEPQAIDLYRNQGGFDLLGSGRDKIETKEQFDRCVEVVQKNKLDGLVIVGGDDSNTNAAHLAEVFLQRGIKCAVVGVPKTIDGDLKNQDIEISFGFDTATKIYSDTLGSLQRDALSAKKYFFFVKLMGRSASHIALECALRTHPNLTLISEEILAKKMTLDDVVAEIARVIQLRQSLGKNYGVILIPEGLIEFLPDVNTQLFSERDPHGNVQVSKIETERLLQTLVEKHTFEKKLSIQPLFLGYEGRSCFPTNFDADYTYSLGMTAALLIKERCTGRMACVQNLAAPRSEWIPVGVPLFGMISFELRKGKRAAVIKKALVDLNGVPFAYFESLRQAWEKGDHYRYPGPVQYFGPQELTDKPPLTLLLEKSPCRAKASSDIKGS